MSSSKFKPGDRVVVWITQRDDVQEGDGGTVIRVSKGPSSIDATYLDVILDSGIRMGHYHSGTFRHEHAWNSEIPF